jgi:hypothetical protein
MVAAFALTEIGIGWNLATVMGGHRWTEATETCVWATIGNPNGESAKGLPVVPLCWPKVAATDQPRLASPSVSPRTVMVGENAR